MTSPPRRFKTNRESPPSTRQSNATRSSTSTHPSDSTSRTLPRKYKDCRYCDREHPLRKCFRFRKLSVQERLKVVRRYNYCFNCLAHSHLVKKCSSRERCKVCSKDHHTLLHINYKRGTSKQKTNRRRLNKNNNRHKSSPRSPVPTTPEIQANPQVSTATSSAPTIVINVTSKV